MTAGYSKTPLLRKLGIKSGFSISTYQAPDNYWDLLGELPEDIKMIEEGEKLDFIHAFFEEKIDLECELPKLKAKLKPNAMLWISWIKKAAKIPTDVTEAIVREKGLAIGLVDIKICAVDEKWSGLKFVYRVKDRDKL